MMIYFLIGFMLLALIIVLAIKNLRSGVKPHDSKLKKRAIFSANEQLTFARLKQVLPTYIILANVSFDSLLTTKFNHTRSKYRNMIANFVVLGHQNEVLAIIAMEDYFPTKKHKDAIYEEKILKLAGYRVFHVYGVPTLQQLNDEFKYFNDLDLVLQDIAALKKYEYCCAKKKHRYSLS